MTKRFAVVMDPIEHIKTHKDTTFALLLAAQARGFDIFYMEQKDLNVQDGKPVAQVKQIKVKDDPSDWFEVVATTQAPLTSFDIIFMRKDPPFDMQYIYTTYMLELAENAGVFVANKPQSLRDANEKFVTTWFADCCPPTLISCDHDALIAFHEQHGDVVFKPLEGMGGASVYRLKPGDPNLTVILDQLTQGERRYIMGQTYIPEITEGDKRVHIIDGEVFPYGLRRVPKKGEWRGNLAAGASGEAFKIGKQEQQIGERVGPVLRDHGIVFAGIDIIGNYLTEINVTSPTCIREVDAAFNTNIADDILAAIEKGTVV
jgi:glutathione synthase